VAVSSSGAGPVAAVPPRLAALVRDAGGGLLRATPITALRSREAARTFRLELADGRTLKGRVLESEARAAEMQRLVALAGDGYAQVLARDGEAVLEEWVAGRPPAADDWTAALLRQAGALLGRLHALSAPPEAAARGTAFATAQLEERLAIAARHGALSPSVLRAARSATRAWRPMRAATGLVHVDFCAENLILAAPGRLACVDNATLTTGALDGDLARTWYRWPLDAAGRQAFLAGYEAHRGAGGFLAHAAFWALHALAISLAFRARLGAESLDQPRALLERLLADGTPAHAAGALFAPGAARRATVD
jgi:Ser/Thr protein kinase RdoA (MazF antagonist)